MIIAFQSYILGYAFQYQTAGNADQGGYTKEGIEVDRKEVVDSSNLFYPSTSLTAAPSHAECVVDHRG
jgi:hypothetical protein